MYSLFQCSRTISPEPGQPPDEGVGGSGKGRAVPPYPNLAVASNSKPSRILATTIGFSGTGTYQSKVSAVRRIVPDWITGLEGLLPSTKSREFGSATSWDAAGS